MTLIINDLQKNTELDGQAMSGIRGGYTSMVNSLVTTMGPYKGLKFGQPSTYFKKDLTNYSDQLNIAVGSFNVAQGNANSVTQY